MDKFYFNTKKVVYKFILITLSVVLAWCLLFSRTGTVNGYIWFCFALIVGSYVSYLSGRYVMAALNKKPALVVTDEYLQIYQSGNNMTNYLSTTFYWNDISFYRKYLSGNKKNIEIGFYNPIKVNGKFQLAKLWLTRKRTISFNTDVVDAHIDDIMSILDKYCLIYEDKQPSV